MGIFDMARDMLAGAQSQDGDPKAALLQSVVSMLANSAQNGGLQGVLATLQHAGLGDVVRSWVGTGDNLPISAAQLQQALGNGQLAELAEMAGISHDSAASHLADMLPGIVDKLTPHGEVPADGLGDIGSLLTNFFAK